MGRGWWESVSVAEVATWTSSQPADVVFAALEQQYRWPLGCRRSGWTLVVFRRGRGRAFVGDVTLAAVDGNTTVTSRVDAGAQRVLRSTVTVAVVAALAWWASRSSFLSERLSLGGLSGRASLQSVAYFATLASAICAASLLGLPTIRARQIKDLYRGLTAAGLTFHASPGWYVDPTNSTIDRWWDGTEWTSTWRLTSAAVGRRRLLVARIVGPVVFFGGFLGLPVLLSANARQSDPVASVRTVIPVAGVAPEFADAGARLRFISQLESVASQKVATALGPLLASGMTLTVHPPSCSNCGVGARWTLDVRSRYPIEPVVGEVALGAGRLVASVIDRVDGSCGTLSSAWIPDTDHSPSCPVLGATITDLGVTSAGGMPSYPPDAGPPSGVTASYPVVIGVAPMSGAALDQWMQTHPGVGIAVSLDGRVLATLSREDGAASLVGGTLRTVPMRNSMGTAVQAALTPPQVPR